MHEAGSHHDGSATAVTQAEADHCCATSEHHDSAPSKSTALFAVSLTLVSSPVSILLPAVPPRAEAWRTADAIPIARVAKHLLLSVFLL